MVVKEATDLRKSNDRPAGIVLDLDNGQIAISSAAISLQESVVFTPTKKMKPSNSRILSKMLPKRPQCENLKESEQNCTLCMTALFHSNKED